MTTRSITDRAEIAEVWEHIASEQMQSAGWDFDYEADEEEGVYFAVETFSGSGRQPIYEVHYELPEDWNDCPEGRHVYRIEERPNYVIVNTREGIVVDSSDGESHEIPMEEDEDAWTAIERYDDEHGTHLWEAMDEKLITWEGF